VQNLTLNVAQEFTPRPGPRTRDEGEFSAEQFLAEVLLKRFDNAVKDNAVLLVDLDGGYGYATSFLEGAFGGLAREKGIDVVSAHLDIKSDEEPYLIDSIKRYIKEAHSGPRRR
jgi:hypothetical protein